MPSVSVILPTFNCVGFLKEAIQSVLTQTYEAWELIVIDDGSTDGTDDLIKKIGDPRVRYFYQTNQGKSAARNCGIVKSQAAYLAFLDSDDIWLPHKLTQQMSYAKANPDVGLIYSHVMTYHVDRPTERKIKPSHTARTFRELLNGPRSIYSPSVLIRRSCLDVVGVFDRELPVAQDFDLWLRIARRFQIDCSRGVVCHVREHPGNSSSNREKLYEGYWKLRLKILERYGADLTEESRRQSEAFLVRYQYLLGMEYLHTGRAREALRMVGGAIARDWKLGRLLRKEGEGPWKEACLLAKPYMGWVVSGFCALMPTRWHLRRARHGVSGWER